MKIFYNPDTLEIDSLKIEGITEYANDNPSLSFVDIDDPILDTLKQKTRVITPPSLQFLKDEAKQRVNAITQESIFAKYPQPKQANMQARFSQLIFLNQAYPANPEVIAIQAVWEDILAMRTASNVANTSIDNATNESEINAIINAYHV